MNVIFTGTAAFAGPSLESVIASHHNLLAVITQPDKPKGRGQDMHMSIVKEIALAHSIPILQPENISAPESVEQIKALGLVDVNIVVAYGQKISSELLNWPGKGTVNVHGSILPKYRGAAPIQRAIMNGETETGVTTMLMDEGWDTGDILLQKTVDIDPCDNANDLAERMAWLGAKLLIDTLEGLEDGTIAPIPQDNELATTAPSLKRNEGMIDWERAAEAIVNQVRGCTPKPGAFTKLNDTLIKVWGAAVDEHDGKYGEPGEVLHIDKCGILVAAREGSVAIIEIQPESRKRMCAADYARGADLEVGDKFHIRFPMPVQ